MKNYFTHEDVQPSEQTLSIIRQIAYTYRSINVDGRCCSYCLN